ncbi:MAG: S9 family peptidase [Chitinophagaceae bacterium]|nr:S9 family peptidase [Chitinophagaceae bacterium]
MKNISLIFFSLLSLQALAQHAHQSPVTTKVSQSDQYFGTKIDDPYRWLEDDNAATTSAWVKMQNEYTQQFIGHIPYRKKVNDELTKMWNYEKYSSPFKEGDYYLFYKNNGLQNQSVLYIQKGLDGQPSELINPNTLNDKGTAALNSVQLSKNQKYCAYSISNAGSDWQDIYVINMATRKLTTDVINYSKFSGIAWKGDEGFYYSGYDKPANENDKYSAKTEFQKIFFHTLGTPQSKDKLIYEDKNHPLKYKGAVLSEDERWLVLSISEGTDGSELFYLDLMYPRMKSFKVIGQEGYTINQDFIDNLQYQFLILSNKNAPNYQLLLVDLRSGKETAFVPEKAAKLDAVTRVGDKIFCKYLKNASSKIEVYDLKGVLVDSIALPGLVTVSGLNGSAKDDHTFYTFNSFNAAPTIYKYDLKTGKSELFKEAKLNVPMAATVVEQLWFTSKDGKQVPMFVYHRADVDLNAGPHPVLLYGYGGFNISLTPGFSIPMSYFVQKGGIYVSVSLRGGSEFGEDWHKMGMLSHKQTVFDDFIAAAEYLIKKNITNPKLLAIHGRSNGGLLVGACMTQRPDLFKVALPGVGVLDMLRYHKFTVGWGWAVEYGSSDKKEDFEYLIKYSPLHNIKKGTHYPSTLITTADHDDRVVPAHSFKFAAALQEAHAGDNPVMIRIDVQAGHGAGKPTSKQIDEWSDVMSFVFQELGMKIN